MAPVSRVIPIRPIKGMWTFDIAQDCPSGASPDMLNFQLFQGYIRKRPGYGRYQTGSAFPGGSITGVASAQLSAGTRSLYATNATGLYKYNTGTTSWDVQTGPALTGSATDLFSFEVSQNNLVFSQLVDNIMALPLTGTVYAVINANAKPSRSLTRWNQRLYTGFTVEGGSFTPFRVRWSAYQDHTDWVGVSSGFADMTDDVYQVRYLRKLLDTLCVYTEKGIFLATRTGVATSPADFSLQVKDVGLLSPFSLQGHNVLHFFLGTDNIYMFNGTQLSPLAMAVRTTIFSDLNASAVLRNFGLLLYDSQEYCCFIVTGSNSACGKAWVYNWARDAVYPWQFATAELTCGCLHYLDSGVTIAQLSGTIASQTWVLGAATLTSNVPIPILGSSAGRVLSLVAGILSDDGAAFTCRWTSKDYTARDISPEYGNEMVTMKDVAFTYVDPGSQFTLQFYFSIDRGVSWSGPYPVSVGGGSVGAFGDAMCTQQSTGKRVRFKIENTTINELPQVAAFEVTLELRKQKVA
jgi:hypothetical protein